MTKIQQVELGLELIERQEERKSLIRSASFQDKLVSVLSVVKPTLEWIEGFIFTPKRWKKAIRAILLILNSIESASAVTFEA